MAAQAFAPVILPLFDGVVVNDPYRYLAPPSGADGSPSSAALTLPINGNASPAFAVYTSETPPQAELLAHGGELAIGAGSSSVKVKIDPVPPASSAAAGSVAGNVYRFTVTDQAGLALALLPSQSITLAMRGPAGISAGAAIARFVDNRWQAMPTAPSGLQDLFLTNIDAFGDFALVGAVPDNPSGFNPTLLIGALVVAGLIALLGIRGRATPDSAGQAPAKKKHAPQRPSRTRNRR